MSKKKFSLSTYMLEEEAKKKAFVEEVDKKHKEIAGDMFDECRAEELRVGKKFALLGKVRGVIRENIELKKENAELKEIVLEIEKKKLRKILNKIPFTESQRNLLDKAIDKITDVRELGYFAFEFKNTFGGLKGRVEEIEKRFEEYKKKKGEKKNG